MSEFTIGNSKLNLGTPKPRVVPYDSGGIEKHYNEVYLDNPNGTKLMVRGSVMMDPQVIVAFGDTLCLVDAYQLICAVLAVSKPSVGIEFDLKSK